VKACGIGIRGMESAAVVIDGAFPHHDADRPLHGIHLPPLSGWYPAQAGVLLLLSKVTQKRF
jgi:hypothetical protein